MAGLGRAVNRLRVAARNAFRADVLAYLRADASRWRGRGILRAEDLPELENFFQLLRSKPSPETLLKLGRNASESEIPAVVWQKQRYGYPRLPLSQWGDTIAP